MRLEAVVFQQLQSSCSYASSQSRMTTTTTNTSIRREDEDRNICPMSTAPIDTVSSSSTSSLNEAACVIPTSNVNVEPQAGATEDTAVVGCCRKRRKSRRNSNERSTKDEAEMERQRRMHIEVERNRRKQINNYLALLASLMPPPYSHRGDQASVVGGAINFLKELEQLLQYLQSHNKRIKLDHHHQTTTPAVFSDFFSFPQYSTMSPATSIPVGEPPTEAVADVEVVVVERHVTVKVLSRKQPKQLLRMLVELESAHLTILHLNVTSIDGFELYSFSLKKEDECQLNTVNEIATAVYNMIRRIQQHAELQL